LLLLPAGCGRAPASANPPPRGSQTAPDDIEGASESESLAVFSRRILPILDAANPSSCAECHLGGVDLKQYIDRDQARTFAALREAGLIDAARPDESKLLAFIQREPEGSTPVSQEVRRQEYEAFRAWIRAAVADPQLRAADSVGATLGPDLPMEVVRHARRDRVLQSFLDNFWSEVGRCAACHSPRLNQEQVAKHGEQVSWIVPDDPQATLDYLAGQGLIDTAAPDQSLVLLKPTLQVEHGGGQKMAVGDRTYRQFRRFLDDYAAVVNGAYRAADELPQPAAEVSQVTDVWLKLEGVPSEFDKLVLQADVYRWLPDENRWSAERWATADRPVYGAGQLWQQHLSVTAPRGSPRAAELSSDPRLPAGLYLVKVYVDTENRLADRYPYELGQDEFVGQVEVESSWPAGYGSMTVVRYPD
jgi:hypothetical protein